MGGRGQAIAKRGGGFSARRKTLNSSIIDRAIYGDIFMRVRL